MPAARPPARRGADRGALADDPGGGSDPTDRSRSHRLPLATRLLGWMVVILAVVVAVWLGLGLVRAVLRWIEFAVVGVAGGWVGYRVGVFKGRRSGKTAG